MSEIAVREILKNLGLTGKEAEVYIFLAKRGPLKGGQIAKQLKKHSAQIYRILKRLQNKALIESTLEAPMRFTAIPFEKALDQFIKIKQEEAAFIERTKKEWLKNWERISKDRIQPTTEKFAVIEGSKSIYSKMLQMVMETKKYFSAILSVPGLARSELFGIFDAAYEHPLKSQLKFQFLTKLTNQNLKATKLLIPKLKSEISFKAINPLSNLRLLPRMVIRDGEEILFFISPKTDMFSTGQDEACLFINSKSLVQTLIGTFEDLWEDSINFEDRIFEIETGKLLSEPFLEKDVDIATKYDVALSTVKEQVRSLPLLTAHLSRIEHSLPKMVGREEKLGQLEEYLKQVLEGKGNTVFISGEAGIGKTRLVEEIIPHALSHNLRVFKSKCSPETSLPLSPFRKILMDLFNVSKEDNSEVRLNKIGKQIEEVAPQLMPAIPIVDNIIASCSIPTGTYLDEIRGVDPNDLASFFKSEEGFATLAKLLVSFSEKQSIMLFIDNLHLADSSSLKLFENLARTTQKSNLFLIGAYRQEALTKTAQGMTHPLLNILDRLSSNNLSKKIELEKLGQIECLALVNNILGINEYSLGKRIYKETEGNPLFVIETLRFLINKGLLTRKDNKWKPVKEFGEIAVPPSIRDTISCRIHILKEEERDILDCASVVGEAFTSDMIESIAGLDRLRILKKLNNIERNYQLIHSFDGKYRFDHTNIREVIYQEMAPELRREYHSLIAEHMETLGEDPKVSIYDLAHHYYMSGNSQKAVPYLFEAGERSRSEWAVFETIRYFSQALELMGDDENWKKERTKTFEALGGLYGLATEHELANECYQKGIASTDDGAIKERMRRNIRRKKIVENKGVKLSYYVYGKDEPTVLLYSWTSSAESWIPQVTYFSQKYTVVTLDMRGTGESDKPPGDYTVDMHMNDLEVIIDDLQARNIILVSALFGGKVAVKYVANFPRKISKLVLLGFEPAPFSKTPSFEKKKFEKTREKALKSPSWFVKAIWKYVFPDPGFESFREWGIKSSEKTPPEIFRNGIFSYWKEDVRPILEKIRIPTLIIYGDKSIYDLKKANNLNKRISGSKTHIFRNMDSNFINLFATNKFNKILEDFINTGEISCQIPNCR